MQRDAQIPWAVKVTRLGKSLLPGKFSNENRSYVWEVLIFLAAAMAIGALVIRAVGEDPVHVYSNLLAEAFLSKRGLMIAVQRATPYIFTTLAAGLAFRGGAINMGLDGQFMVGAAIAGIAGYGLPDFLPAPLRILCIFLLCGMGGAAAAFVPAIFKRISGVNEVITGMIANLLMPFLLSSVIHLFPGLRAARAGASDQLPVSSWLPQFNELPLGGWGFGTRANVAIFIGLGLTVFLALWIRHSKLGYEIRMSRANFSFAQLGGISAGRMFFVSMMLSGAIAGMAGATEVLGVWRQAAGTTLAVGNKGLVLALVGGGSFYGGTLASLIYGGLEAGAMNASWFTSIPRPLIDVLVQLLFVMTAVPSMRRFFTGSSSSDFENLGGSFLKRPT
jgi:simple sugar transport system permease protein